MTFTAAAAAMGSKLLELIMASVFVAVGHRICTTANKRRCNFEGHRAN